MKAFALANAQGQKMYTITKQNIDKVLPMIQASALTKGDIRNAVNAGKTVTVHEREVSVPGFMVFDMPSCCVHEQENEFQCKKKLRH